MKPVTAAQMRAIDKKTVSLYGIPSILLMENAGAKCAAEILRSTEKKNIKNVSIFCGPGNNGGDGFVTTRHLHNAGLKTSTFFFQKPSKISADSKTNYDILRKMGLKLIDCSGKIPWSKITQSLSNEGIIVDALFGSGLSRDIGEPFLTVIHMINSAKQPVVSVDIPSGLHADTGHVMGAAIKADLTITLAAPKKAVFTKEAAFYVGKLRVVDISIPKELFR